MSDVQPIIPLQPSKLEDLSTSKTSEKDLMKKIMLHEAITQLQNAFKKDQERRKKAEEKLKKSNKISL